MNFVSFLLCCAVLSSGVFAAAPFSGTVEVFQNDPGNNSSSVGLRLSAATSPGVVIDYPPSNRGDYVIDVPAANDVMEGVLLSCVANNGRNHGAGIGYATSGTAIGAGTYWIPVHRAATGEEFNADTAFAWFDYAHWLGAATVNSGGSLSLFSASPGIAMGSQLIDHGNGTSTVNLTSLGAHSADGVLLVNSAENQNKFALSRANGDGTFTVFNRNWGQCANLDRIPNSLPGRSAGAGVVGDFSNFGSHIFKRLLSKLDVHLVKRSFPANSAPITKPASRPRTSSSGSGSRNPAPPPPTSRTATSCASASPRCAEFGTQGESASCPHLHLHRQPGTAPGRRHPPLHDSPKRVTQGPVRLESS